MLDMGHNPAVLLLLLLLMSRPHDSTHQCQHCGDVFLRATDDSVGATKAILFRRPGSWAGGKSTFLQCLTGRQSRHRAESGSTA